MQPLRIYLLALVAVLPALVQAQKYNFNPYSVNEGLPRAGVYNLYEDHFGFIWIATEGGGAAVFDGTHFETFDIQDGLASDVVRCMGTDAQERLWFGTNDNGISIREQNHFININTTNGLRSNTVRSMILAPDSSMWVGTFGGIAVITGDSVVKTITKKNGLPSNKVRSILRTADDQMWIGTDEGVAIYEDGKVVKIHSVETGLPSNQALCLYEDKRGHVWVGTNKGVAHINQRVEIFDVNHGLIHDRVRAITEDANGHLWFGTKQGVSRFNGISFTHYTEKEGLSNNRIRSIITDRAGNLWFGTYFGGICKFGGEDFTYYRQRDGLTSNQIKALNFLNEKTLAVGTPEGLDIVELKNNRVNNVRKIATDQWIRTIASKDEITLIGTDDQVHQLLNNKIIKVKISGKMPSDEINAISFQSDSIVWLGTTRGLVKASYTSGPSPKMKVQQLINEHHGLKGRDIIMVRSDFLNRVWVISRDGGLDILNHGSVMEIKDLNKIPKAVALVTRGEMTYVGTNGHGIYGVKTKGKELDITRLKDAHVSQGDYVYSMVLKDDYLWCGIENGILKVKLAEDGAPERATFLGKGEGFDGVENSYNAIALDPTGAIWFGTINGLIRYHSKSSFSHNSEPLVYLTDVELFYKKVKWEDNEYAEGTMMRFNVPRNLILPYKSNNLTFNVTALDYNAPEQVRYQWKLEPLEETWSIPRKDNRIVYSNLPPNEYTFYVRAEGISGIWNEQPYVYKFVIEPPYYQTIPFIIGCILFGLLLFFIFYRWRIRVLKAEQRKLAKLIAERTAELENEKRLVEEQHEEIEQQKVQLEEANEILEETNQSMTDSINYAKRIQAAIMQPKGSDELENELEIFYRPKDIVSGDFYWFSRLDDADYICAADCTGHGVPGAFMSMIGITSIKDIINKKHILNPGRILDELRLSVVNALNEKGFENTKDGMDLAFYKIDRNTNEVTYAGANNPIWFISRQAPEVITSHTELRSFEFEGKDVMLHEITASKMPIGLSDQMDIPFTEHKVKLQESDLIWVFSDGYVDQFGGSKGKKYLGKRFRDFLTDIEGQDLKAQMDAVIANFDEWMGEGNQVDDILVMGMRV